jgi:hypothetical protein
VVIAEKILLILFHSLRREKVLTIFWLESLTGRDHLEDLGVDGKKY